MELGTAWWWSWRASNLVLEKRVDLLIVIMSDWKKRQKDQGLERNEIEKM